MGAAFRHPIKMALSSIIQEMYDILYIQFVILMSYTCAFIFCMHLF